MRSCRIETMTKPTQTETCIWKEILWQGADEWEQEDYQQQHANVFIYIVSKLRSITIEFDLFVFIISLNDDFIIIYRRYFTYVTQMVLLFAMRGKFFIKNIILRLERVNEAVEMLSHAKRK